MSQQILENRQGTQSTSTATTTAATHNNETCVTCRMTSLRDSKLGNYTTHKFNQIYQELFVSFDGVDGGVCGSCYKKCYNERVKRGILHRKDKGHLTTSNIVTGVRERRSTTLANTTTAAATIANTEPQQQPKRSNKRNRHQYNNNENSKNDPSPPSTTRQQFSLTKKKRENSLQQPPSSMNNNHSSSSSTQVNNNNHHELQLQHSHTNNNNDLITSDHFNSSTTTTTISSHHDQHQQHHYASTIATAVEPTVNVYFDFRLLLPDQDNKQQHHHHHHHNDDNENDDDSYEFDRTSKRIQIVKASIASALPVTALKREVKFELKELLLIQHQQHQYKQQRNNSTIGNSTNNKSKHDDQPYKLDDIKLFERDASGQIIEVDLMDDDEFFMQTPIEDKTRFVVYLRPNSTH